MNSIEHTFNILEGEVFEKTDHPKFSDYSLNIPAKKLCFNFEEGEIIYETN